ncbi:NAD(P)-binding protein [Violaceomyces palustris]|uniref:NAD(P)-binding protein n=1 Tax=Violaceomyces palustris TaxID=1673888 RepID=A0ACD0NPJ9_9BASI|nr:NAD(P)-binding protein [Violaceomyces palustris]
MTAHTCNWGILATGGIATTFTKDLLTDPKSRKVDDIQHKVVAVASSSSVERAKAFISEVGADPSQCNAYGSYEEFVKDDKIDIVYIATPHSHHYENALLCLEAGKNVLCEKPFTINEKQSAHLVKVARQKNLFLMEAVWTRFFPITIAIQKLLHEDKVLGKIHRVYSDLSMAFKPDPKHRLYAPELGGGALLDLGIYPLTWQMLLLYQHPDNKKSVPKVTSSLMKTPLTGVDEYTTLILDFEGVHAQGIVTSSLSVKTSEAYCVHVQGEKGSLSIPWATYRPESYVLTLKDEQGKLGQPETKVFEIPGHGMFWEADACARGLRDGKKELERCSLDESLLTMRIMDQVRYSNDFRYPENLEAVRSDA